MHSLFLIFDKSCFFVKFDKLNYTCDFQKLQFKIIITTFMIKILFICLFFTISLAVLDRTFFIYLGLPITATLKQIQAAYQAKSAKIEAIEDSQEKTKKSKILNLAYTTLKTQSKKKIYERYGKDNIDKITQVTSYNRMTDTDSRKGKTFNLQIGVPITQIYNGTTIHTQFYRKTACDKCHGTGAQSPKLLTACGTCGGKGFSLKNVNMWGQMLTVQENCGSCHGTGKIVKKICPACQGKKLVEKLVNISIPIEKGLPNGNQLTIPNFGEQQEVGAPSDLKVKIIEISTPQWSRQKDNLIYNMEISFQQSALGFQKSFTHLNGQTITITQSQVTLPTFTKTIYGYGIENPKTGDTGDLIVKFKIVMPNFTDNQLQKWQQFFERHGM